MTFNRKFIGIALVALLAAPAFAKNTSTTGSDRLSQPNIAEEFGLGLVVGEPSGPTAKLWLNLESAVDLGLAFSIDHYTLVFSDYLYHFPGSRLVPYIGVGGVMAFASDRDHGEDRPFLGRAGETFGLGVRVPVGIEWFAPRPHIGVYAELVPGIALIPDTSSYLDAGIGARFYF